MVGLITSFSNPHVKALTALHQRKTRRETGLFLVEGARHVADGVASGWAIHTLIYDPKTVDARYEAKHLMPASPEILAKISKKDNPQNVIAAFYQRAYTADDLDEQGVWIALEGVRDPGNLGTILRTVHAGGGRGVVLVGECCDIYSTEVMRASMGSLFAVPVIKMSQDDFVTRTAQWKGSVVGTAMEPRAVDFRQMNYKLPCMVVMGTEQSGLSDIMLKAMPELVKLPMREGVDSLNLSVATGVMLYAVLHPKTPL